MRQRAMAAIVALGTILAGAAGAQELPRGWYLEEQEMSGINDMFLSWYDPESGDVLMSIHCQEGWPDVVLTAYVEEPEGAAPLLLVVADGDLRHAMEAIGGTVDGRYSVGGITRFEPELVDLLSGQFTVLVDGVEAGRYSSKTATEAFARMFAACPPGEAQ